MIDDTIYYAYDEDGNLYEETEYGYIPSDDYEIALSNEEEPTSLNDGESE